MNCRSVVVIDSTDNRIVHLTVTDKGYTSGTVTYDAILTAQTNAGVRAVGPFPVTFNGSNQVSVDATFTSPVLQVIGTDYDDGSGGGAVPRGISGGGTCCCCALLATMIKCLCHHHHLGPVQLHPPAHAPAPAPGAPKPKSRRRR